MVSAAEYTDSIHPVRNLRYAFKPTSQLSRWEPWGERDYLASDSCGMRAGVYTNAPFQTKVSGSSSTPPVMALVDLSRKHCEPGSATGQLGSGYQSRCTSTHCTSSMILRLPLQFSAQCTRTSPKTLPSQLSRNSRVNGSDA